MTASRVAAIAAVFVLTLSCRERVASYNGPVTLEGQVILYGVMEQFRLAMMAYTVEGERIFDLFENSPPYEGPNRFGGNSKDDIYPVLKGNIGYMGFKPFSTIFPEYVDRKFTLTFREFSGGKFSIPDVPRGTLFIWIQTPIDGNAITQIPLVLNNNLPGRRVVNCNLRTDGLFVEL